MSQREEFQDAFFHGVMTLREQLDPQEFKAFFSGPSIGTNTEDFAIKNKEKAEIIHGEIKKRIPEFGTDEWKYKVMKESEGKHSEYTDNMSGYLFKGDLPDDFDAENWTKWSWFLIKLSGIETVHDLIRKVMKLDNDYYTFTKQTITKRRKRRFDEYFKEQSERLISFLGNENNKEFLSEEQKELLKVLKKFKN